MSPHEILKQYWGHDAFRPLQEEIIDSVLQGRDTLALLPTGGGKSVCFQVPALAQQGICIVVSPLIALMRDQVEGLRRKRIRAACLYGGMKRHERDVLLNQCVFGDMKFLYLSPEMLRSETFVAHYRQMRVCLIAVDEAHCISQWGYDFRPPYLRIGEMRKHHPAAPVLALTATATATVARDIQRRLLFRAGRVFTGSFVRPNLAYMALREEDKAGRLLRLARKAGGSGIVYVRTRRRTADVAAQLRAQGLTAVAYHGGLDTPTRHERQRQWMEGAAQVMVATNAFGMGIDKPDVRFVAHLDIPTSPEAYFQEAGRAGRDGAQAYGVLLFNDADLAEQERWARLAFPEPAYIRGVYDALCNYYRLPPGSGEGTRFAFGMEDFCRAYSLSPLPCHAALRILCQEGLIDLPEREETISRLLILASREDLYRFQVAHRPYDRLLQALLRLFGGLFTEYTHIYEGKVARHIGAREEEVCLMLRRLDRMGVVSYDERMTGARIVFTAPRATPNGLTLNETDYNMRRQRAEERAAAMRRYATDNTTCRSQQLLVYFGEQGASSCGVCDVCLRQGGSSRPSTRERVLALLGQRPHTVKQLADALLVMDADGLAQDVRTLLDEGRIRMDSTGHLSINKGRG